MTRDIILVAQCRDINQAAIRGKRVSNMPWLYVQYTPWRLFFSLEARRV